MTAPRLSPDFPSCHTGHLRDLALAPAGRPGLRGHHPRCHASSSTRTACGDARRWQERSRSAAFAGPMTSLVGSAGAPQPQPSQRLLGAERRAPTTSEGARARHERPAATLCGGDSARAVDTASAAPASTSSGGRKRELRSGRRTASTLRRSGGGRARGENERAARLYVGALANATAYDGRDGNGSSTR